MTDNQAIKQARERAARTFQARPSLARSTSVTRARLTEGCHCEISEDAWSLAADMPTEVGGTDKAPTPGVLGRGALASCYAIGIASLAADRGIRLDALSVEVQADWDVRGWIIPETDIAPGYSQIRIIAEIESPASDADIRALVRDAERQSPYVDVYRRANDVVTDVVLNRAAAE